MEQIRRELQYPVRKSWILDLSSNNRDGLVKSQYESIQLDDAGVHENWVFKKLRSGVFPGALAHFYGRAAYSDDAAILVRSFRSLSPSTVVLGMEWSTNTKITIVESKKSFQRTASSFGTQKTAGNLFANFSTSLFLTLLFR